jgi:hypothetical protein
MQEYEFKVNRRSRLYLEEIRFIMYDLFGISVTEALVIINNYWSKFDDIEEDWELYREKPYYWALSLTPIKYKPEVNSEVRWWMVPKYKRCERHYDARFDKILDEIEKIEEEDGLD